MSSDDLKANRQRGSARRANVPRSLSGAARGRREHPSAAHPLLLKSPAGAERLLGRGRKGQNGPREREGREVGGRQGCTDVGCLAGGWHWEMEEGANPSQMEDSGQRGGV